MGVIGSTINQQITKAEVKRAREHMDSIIKRVQLPDFDYTKLKPEEYKVLREYAPEVAAYVEEKAPELVALSADGQMGREAQMEALNKYRNLGKTGEDVQSRLLVDSALRDSAIQNQGQQASIQDSMARRGMSGSGLDLASQLMAQQGASQTGTRAAQDRALSAYQTRLDALRQGSELGSQIRGEDVSLDTMNTGRTNDYNQRYAANQNAYNQYASGTRNEAQLKNIGAQQAAADINTGNRNQAAQDYQNRYNQLKQQEYGNTMGKAQTRAGMAQGKVDDAIAAGKEREASMAATRGMIASMFGGGGGDK